MTSGSIWSYDTHRALLPSCDRVDRNGIPLRSSMVTPSPPSRPSIEPGTGIDTHTTKRTAATPLSATKPRNRSDLKSRARLGVAPSCVRRKNRIRSPRRTRIQSTLEPCALDSPRPLALDPRPSIRHYNEHPAITPSIHRRVIHLL